MLPSLFLPCSGGYRLGFTSLALSADNQLFSCQLSFELIFIFLPQSILFLFKPLFCIFYHPFKDMWSHLVFQLLLIDWFVVRLDRFDRETNLFLIFLDSPIWLKVIRAHHWFELFWSFLRHFGRKQRLLILILRCPMIDLQYIEGVMELTIWLWLNVIVLNWRAHTDAFLLHFTKYIKV